MKRNTEVKEAILQAATELITQANGDIRQITARTIAEKSGVALGLINYHFESKDNLIAICVQQLLNRYLQQYAPNRMDYTKEDGLSDKQRLISFATQTFDFLYANPSMAKISILSDLKDYQPNCNSALTVRGFCLALRTPLPDAKKQQIAFTLVSAMQAAFLTGSESAAILGYQLTEKKERDRFISDTVTALMEGIYEA